jgi:hypothetical protein
MSYMPSNNLLGYSQSKSKVKPIEFVAAGAELYQGERPEGAKVEH